MNSRAMNSEAKLEVISHVQSRELTHEMGLGIQVSTAVCSIQIVFIKFPGRRKAKWKCEEFASRHSLQVYRDGHK